MRKGSSALLNDRPGISPANRSLERGVEVLRAFRPGSELLGNGEIAERTGLSRSTVSRLTQTLVGAGMLDWNSEARAYRLSPAVLSLAHAMRSGSRVLSAAEPLMHRVAESHRINVGLAAPDRDEMVYLESIRYAPTRALRRVVSGQRVPMELTSLGHAYLASAGPDRRSALLAHFSRQRRKLWPEIARSLDQSRVHFAANGYCVASWQPEVVALARSFLFEDDTYVLNVSVRTAEPVGDIAANLSPVLLGLVETVQDALASARP